jgi:hypothetical protein
MPYPGNPRTQWRYWGKQRITSGRVDGCRYSLHSKLHDVSKADYLDPCNTDLLEKLTVAQLVKFLALYGTRRCITVAIDRSPPRLLTRARWIQSTSSHQTCLISISTSSSYQCIVFSSFPTEILEMDLSFILFVLHSPPIQSSLISWP